MMKLFILGLASEGVTLKGPFDMVMEEIKYVLFAVFAIFLIYYAVKRAWLAAFAFFLGFAMIGIFIINPDAILDVSEWLAKLLNIKTETSE